MQIKNNNFTHFFLSPSSTTDLTAWLHKYLLGGMSRTHSLGVAKQLWPFKLLHSALITPLKVSQCRGQLAKTEKGYVSAVQYDVWTPP